MRRFFAVVALAIVPSLGAQTSARPHLAWRTLETPHFIVHYPTEDAGWARYAAERLEAAQPSVVRLVGYEPRGKLTVLVENPTNDANGSTYPFVDAPAIVLWPTPPSPRSDIGHTRGFAEELTTHEYAHAAHLARPSRSAPARRLAALLPVEIGPLLTRVPRWATEGYATYVEGRLTGSGRPHGVARAAVLREFALEGRLPGYAQMSGAGGFLGGGMAYLVGSAYLEWLSNRGGDSSLVHMWRRLSARQSRSFDAAFAGVYGLAPAVLYDRFRAEVTADAFALERARGGAELPAAVGGAAAASDSARLESSRGRLVERFGWYAGDPAASRDGRLLALTLTTPASPTTLMILSTTPDSLTVAQRTARDRVRARDPEDVPAVEHFPRPLHVISRLPARDGFAYTQPRFFADARHVVLTRTVPRSDGTTRPQLFVWDRTTGAIRQITDGVGTSSGDPSPDGREIAAVRCDAGRCDLVLVRVADGVTRTLATGTYDSPWYRPRFSPDGRAIAATMQAGGRWRPVLIDLATGARRELGPADSASRYDPAFTNDGRSVLVTSEAGGIADIERIDVESGATSRLTAVTGAALAPEPAADGRTAYFLTLYAGGFDLRRLQLGDTEAARVAATPAATYALASRVADTAVAPLTLVPSGADRAYGLGPRHWSALPGGSFGAEGSTAVLALANTDPIGRFAVTLQGAYGARAIWRGGALSTRLTALRPALEASIFHLEERPTLQPRAQDGAFGLDADYDGALAAVDRSGNWRSRSARARLGGSTGQLRTIDVARGARSFGFLEGGAGALLLRGRRGAALGAHSAMSAGTTQGRNWRRALVGASVGLRGVPSIPFELEVEAGAMNPAAPVYERFSIGGLASPIMSASLLPQRLAMPVLPTGALAGPRATTYRISAPFAGGRAYWWGGTAGHRQITDWKHVAGFELSGAASDLWLLHVPRVEYSFGAGVPIDRPYAHRVRGYGSLTWRP